MSSSSDPAKVFSGSSPWEPPQFFDTANDGDSRRLRQLLASDAVLMLHDPLDVDGELRENSASVEREEYRIANDNTDPETPGGLLAEGTWVHFPWSRTLARFPSRQLYRHLRTTRNRDLVTSVEQEQLLAATIAVIGLSVGSQILHALVDGGIGGHFILADHDRLDATNLNRLSSGYLEVGEAKIEIAAKRISEKDPWIEQTLLRDGLDVGGMEVLSGVDLVVEEVDDMSIKAAVRLYAQRQGIPLITAADVGEYSIVDVERHDLRDRKGTPFGGRISERLTRQMAGGLSESEKTRVMMKQIGVRYLSSRLLRSVRRIGEDVSGIPQLGMTATQGGAMVTFAARELLLGRRMPSGRYVNDPRASFNVKRGADPLRARLRELVALLRDMRQRKG